MKRQKTLGIILVLVLMLTLTACVRPGEAAGGRRIIRISHGQPETHPIHIALNGMKEEIESKLGDKYEVQIYANGLLGDTKNVLELTQTGALDFVVGSASNMETFNPLTVFHLLHALPLCERGRLPRSDGHRRHHGQSVSIHYK